MLLVCTFHVIVSFFGGWDGASFVNFTAQLQACSRLNLSELASECEQVRTIMQDCGYWLGGYLIHIILMEYPPIHISFD